MEAGKCYRKRNTWASNGVGGAGVPRTRGKERLVHGNKERPHLGELLSWRWRVFSVL